MSAFSDRWSQCMQGSGFPVPTVDDVNEALDFLHKLHDASENSGGAEVTIGALLAAGAVTGVDEAVLATLGEVAAVAVGVYIGACIACMGSVALDDLKGLFASNEVPDFVVAQLNGQGVDLGGTVNA
ncbi:hypothetical protein LJ655_00895 [Paraburkholderia sp. MMS20-SJTN17]|uniref:Uncharacterized protein n=1 Tax=Paraburkholderia translucens TaxID=2886945 RepID=A0ABS8K6T2_9BURK|nr:hypothetical protein [Paraburkholderia sp. MMS20-SJTN17]MCC8400460.1 hypothetical protein [Paraburkholderia sp. MMS20-SJTN17]